MLNTLWKNPVIVKIGDPVEELAVESAQGAAWAMIEDWPMDDGALLDRALAVCAAVDNGKAKPEDARLAFIEAAKEAGILVRS